MGGVVLTAAHGRIEAQPDHHAVVPGAEITYRFVVVEEEAGFTSEQAERQEAAYRDTGRTSQPIPFDLVTAHDGNPTGRNLAGILVWYLIYDEHVAGKIGRAYDIVGRGTHEVNIKWKHEGQHTLLCGLWTGPATDAPLEEIAQEHVLFTQHVSDYWSVQHKRVLRSRRRQRFRGEDIADPFEELQALQRYLEVVEKTEEEHGVPHKKREAYEREMKRIRAYAERLDMILAAYNRHLTVPAYATYTAKDKSEQIDLKIALHVQWDQSEHKITIIDWTNPLDERLHGAYTGRGETYWDAIDDALRAWKNRCQYYHPGHVMIDVPSPALWGSERGTSELREFETPGADFWDHLKDFLEGVALVAGIAAMAIAAIAPVPGSRVVSGLIWTALFTSTSGALIGIGRSNKNGFGDYEAAAFDLLTIAGNMLTAGRLAWTRRAIIATARATTRFERFVLFGEATPDVVEGVLIAQEYYGQFDEILHDSSLSPKERTDKLLQLVGNLATTGAVHFISTRGAKGGKGQPLSVSNQDLRALNDPKRVIRIDDPPKRAGHTQTGEMRTRVQDEPRQAHRKHTWRDGPQPNRARVCFRKAPPPEQRGMRPDDDFKFEQEALESDRIIIVRDSNAAMLRHVGDNTKGPKGVSLKAKTLPEKPPPKLNDPSNAGLAAAHPDDPRLGKMLASMNSPRTGKPPMSYDEFVASLESKGYGVKGAEDDYVIGTRQHPNGYYSDYDLHGVYDRDGRPAYDDRSVKDRLNARFGKNLIQHGPHDEWPDRLSAGAGPNRGPQPPATAYVPVDGPDGKEVRKYQFTSRTEMKQFYEAHNIDWDSIYPGY